MGTWFIGNLKKCGTLNHYSPFATFICNAYDVVNYVYYNVTSAGCLNALFGVKHQHFFISDGINCSSSPFVIR